MKEIHIRGHARGTLQTLLAERPGELDAIVFTNHGHHLDDSFKTLCKSYHRLVFDDVTNTSATIAPKKEHVENILDWAMDKEKIVCACHAGQSRSSAAAYLIACKLWDIDRA